MKENAITVILIEDDPMVQQINKQFIEGVEGFTVVGCASNGKDGFKLIKKEKPDLAFIDIFMPNQDGVTTIRQIRNENLSTDVIAVTAASDIETIRNVLQLGAVDYIMKPFKFDRVQKALKNYRSYHTKLQVNESISQQDLDRLLFRQGKQENGQLPKGLTAHTLEKVILYMKERNETISAEKVAEGIGIARVTARRYLEYMEQIGIVKIHIEYGGIGRPINQYMLVHH